MISSISSIAIGVFPFWEIKGNNGSEARGSGVERSPPWCCRGEGMGAKIREHGRVVMWGGGGRF